MANRNFDELGSVKEISTSAPAHESLFAPILEITSRVFDAPIVAVSCVGENQQWFNIGYGPLSVAALHSSALCVQVMQANQSLIVPDILTDPRFSGDPSTLLLEQVRFYAGTKLESDDGRVVGILSVFDTKPRNLNSCQEELLRLTAVQCEFLIFQRAQIRNALAQVELVRRQAVSQQVQLAESHRLKALGEMACGLSHEINNPLSILLGRLFQLEQGAVSRELVSENVITIARQCQKVVERITKIAKGLRSFASAGDTEAFEDVDVQSVVDSTLSFCHSRIKHLGIALEVDSDGGATTVHCRPVQVSQILVNLLNNSCDALEAQVGRKKIRICFSQTESEAFIAIEDSGQGVSEHALPSLFTPYFTTKPPNKGTGMGLSISRKIAQENGGDLVLDSTANPTRFILKLRKFGIIRKAPAHRVA